MLPKPVMLLLSGGMDSVALLYDLIHQGCAPQCVTFDYGQVHRNEIGFARKHAESNNCKITVIELHRIKDLFLRCALTDGKGGNIVPNRNAVFAHIAAAMAVSAGIQSVVVGCNEDDQAQFPDCTLAFIESVNASFRAAHLDVELCAPYACLTKREIVERARKHRWPIEDSLSCYNGNECGKCDACIKREEALR